MAHQQRRIYPNLAVPRTRWELKVEPQQAGLSVRDFVAKKMPWLGDSEVLDVFARGQIRLGDPLPKGADRSAVGWGPEPVRVEDANVALADQANVLIQIPAPADLPDPAAIPIEVLHDDGPFPSPARARMCMALLENI